MTIEGLPTYIIGSEPRARRRFWSAQRRARRAAEEAVSGEAKPERFIVAVPPGIAHNGTSFGNFIVGQKAGVVTSMVLITATATLT